MITAFIPWYERHAEASATTLQVGITIVDVAKEHTMSIGFDMKLEVIVIPVSDVDRAKRFYSDLGWRLDLDTSPEDSYRVIQFTPPGSGCSIMFGKNMSKAAPGSFQGLHLVVTDLEAALAELLRRGIPVSEPFHDEGGVFHHADGQCVAGGFNPERKSYASYASFSDPDGNTWLLQEVTVPLSADIKGDDPRFTKQLLDAVFGGATA
jgi:catechol 2,3-dioxygenase-like lactoylglutathione lyase family enzyme